MGGGDQSEYAIDFCEIAKEQVQYMFLKQKLRLRDIHVLRQLQNYIKAKFKFRIQNLYKLLLSRKKNK